MLALNTDLRVVWDGVSGFERDLRQAGRSVNTVAAYSQAIRGFAAWWETVNGETFEPGKVTSFDLVEFRRWSLEEQRVAPATWNQRRAALAVFCDWGLKGGLLSYSPLRDLAGAEQEELAPKWLNRGDYGRFMRVVERNLNLTSSDAGRWLALRDQAVVALMVWAGLRESVVCALELGDLDLGERRGAVTVRLGKGQKRRVVPLNAEARRALRLWLEVRTDEGVMVFLGRRGEALQVRGVQRRVADLGKDAGLDITPHVLRHTFAKRLLDSGSPLTVVSKLLGHSRLETTGRYVQPGQDDLLAAVDRI